MCIRVGVILRFVYSCSCHFRIGVFMLVSFLSLCIHVGVIVGVVYSMFFFSFFVFMMVSLLHYCIPFGVMF